MIKVNDVVIEKNHFPDNSQMLLNIPFDDEENYYEIKWQYENDEECMTLYFLVNHFRTLNPKAYFELYMKYCPNARMDRTKSYREVFTLKWFTKFINDLKFDKVHVLDAHSNVSLALIDRVVSINPGPEIRHTINRIIGIDAEKELIFYFPDDGAMKRYKDLFDDSVHIIYGKKVRDWNTGKILGLEVYNEDDSKMSEGDLNGKMVLMIDDIISYGGTLAYSADKLKEYGADKVFAFASHTENSVLDEEKGTLLKRMKNGTLDMLYTTNSIYNSNYEKIEVLPFV